MSPAKLRFIIGVSLMLICILLVGCLPNKQGGFTCICAPLISKFKSVLPSSSKSGQTTDVVTGPTAQHKPPRTGDIASGQKIELASQSIGASGGTIEVTKEGDALDGFVISVPAKSYPDSRIFKVSSAPITNQTFGSDINPISPMITVDNGGAYSEEIMYVRVPVKVPEGNFAMGFIYDEKSKQLEGIPMVANDDESVTIATRHFSSFFISMIEKALLTKNIDSGFVPGIDDWQFTNYGSYIASGGHCEGQANTALWYYCTQPDGKDRCLYGRYDNNGEKPSTPEFWQDDSLGYRFCSVVQKEKYYTLELWYNLAGKAWEKENNKWIIKDVPGIGDNNIFNLFSYSIRATGEPQLVWIRSNAGGGHAMIVYKIVGNALYIADPNYPGNTERKINYYSGESRFKPYNSGANMKEIDQDMGKAYETIVYAGKSAVFPWDGIDKRWTEFKNKTIGNDQFPRYTINVVDDKGAQTALTDSYTTDQKNLVLKSSGVNANTLINVFRDGKLIANTSGQVELNPGNNLLGILIAGEVGNSWDYIDFKYFNVTYEVEEDCKTPPKDILDKLHQAKQFNFTLARVPVTVVADGTWTNMIPRNIKELSFYAPKPRNLEYGTITWSGTSFRYNSVAGYADTMTGSVCYKNGQLLVSFDYSDPDPGDNVKISVIDVPLDPKTLVSSHSGPSVAKTCVNRLEWKMHREQLIPGRKDGSTWGYDAELKAFDCNKGCDINLYFTM